MLSWLKIFYRGKHRTKQPPAPCSESFLNRNQGGQSLEASLYEGETQFLEVNFENYAGYVPLPTVCPCCHHNTHVTVLGGFSFPAPAEPFSKEYGVVAQCQRPICARVFIVTLVDAPAGPNRYQKAVRRVDPSTPPLKQFAAEINSLSPMFVTVYHEAEQALHYGLRQAAGPTFRKAAEFLVKDYAISKHPDCEQEIRTEFLGTVVNKYIGDTRIQSVAKRAIWSGNDETHYTRKWEKINIDDMRRLIDMTCNYLEIEFDAERYEDEMPD